MKGYGVKLLLRAALLLLLSLSFASAVVAQETAPCEKPLSVQDVVYLLERGVPAGRVEFLVNSCGAGFELNADLEDRLRSAGATTDLIRRIARNVKIAAPKVTLRADREGIEAGETVTLTWESSNAAELALEPGVGGVPLQGSREVAPRETTIYHLSARGKGGTAEGSVLISVKSPPPTLNLQADKSQIARGQTVTLSWESTNTTDLTLEPGPGKIGASGSQVVSPQRTTRYRLAARGPGGEVERTLTVHVSNPNPDFRLGRTLTAHTNDVWVVNFSPDGRLVASGSRDGTSKLWDVSTGRLIRTIDDFGVAFSPNGQLLVSGSRDNTIKLWDLSTGRLLRTINSCCRGGFSPDGRLLVTYGGVIKLGGRDYVMFGISTEKFKSVIDVFDVQSGRRLRQLTTDPKGKAPSIALFSPDGKILATTGHGNKIQLWDPDSGALTAEFERRGWSFTFSPNGQIIATSGGRDTIELWDGLTGGRNHVLKGHNKWVQSVAFSPDGRLLATGSDDKTIKVWDVTNGSEVRTLKGHNSGVRDVAFSPDGRFLASASEDHTIKIWEVSTGQLLRTLEGHSDKVTSVAYSSDGSWLASGSDDDTVKLWRRVED